MVFRASCINSWSFITCFYPICTSSLHIFPTVVPVYKFHSICLCGNRWENTTWCQEGGLKGFTLDKAKTRWLPLSQPGHFVAFYFYNPPCIVLAHPSVTLGMKVSP